MWMICSRMRGNWAIHRARKNRKESKSKQVDIRKELCRRVALKTQKKVERERKHVEVKVKNIDVRDIAARFRDLSARYSHWCCCWSQH